MKRITHYTDLYGDGDWCRVEFKRIAVERCTTELARKVMANEIERWKKMSRKKFSGSTASSLTNRDRTFSPKHKPTAAQVAGSPKRKSNAA